MKAFSILIFTFVFFVMPSFSQEDQSWMLWENGVGKRWLTYHLEKEDALKMKETWEKIGDSLDKSSSIYSGTYYQHDFSGYFLRWSPENGYIFIRYFDDEHPCYFSYGNVTVNGIEIEFNQFYEVAESRCPGNSETPKVWIPADGGKYLIPKSEAQNFADLYGGFGAYNGFLRKREGESIFAYRWIEKFTAKKNFILPKSFESLIKMPINAEIISVGKTKQGKFEHFTFFNENVTKTVVEINVGRKQGVKKGLEFVLLNSDDDKYQTLIVTSAGKTKSKAEIIRHIDEDGKKGFPEYDRAKKDFVFKSFTPIQVGLKITTSPMSKF